MSLKDIFGLDFFTPSEHALNDAFEKGRRLGRKEGVKEGLAKRVENTEQISRELYTKLIEFMLDNNLEIGYVEEPLDGDVGLVLRKRR